MPKEFDSDGFLATTNPVLKQPIAEIYHVPLGLARRINRDLHDMLFKADVRNRDDEAIILVTLFLRALEHYQGVVILLENGVVPSARVTVRALMETTFRLRAIVGVADLYKKFILEDMLYRREIANKIRNNSYDFLRDAQNAITDEAFERLKNDIKRLNPKKFHIEELSRLAGMHEWYVGVYSLLSKAVHTQIRELEEYVEIDENGQIKELRYAPQLQEISNLVLTASELILSAAFAFEERFQTGFAPKLEDHRKNLTAAFESHGATEVEARNDP
ncbi:hypothetical protein C3941_18755 [Kaistia algarum]|uniref:DUF5677 domain-containing protein n=1 Tax=Kaistia algarum TaxID=2083279 RepID=UPI000CE89407|nr:DUF5677 domain-containing protein [Kaistia algarum]MCX5516515.1 DUF5677 domain-containing protein [Kaistia algarum]PPE78370.1 hypothetical protein C3941_18755 [Kaistia algarum]